jgi:thiol-disulfide isomerase/thioredoxin
MRSLRLLSAAVLVVPLLFIGTSAQKLVYPPSDPTADIAAALAAAAVDHKNVLIDFGADWCPDCRVLAALFDDAQVAPFVDQHFHVVHVDVGRRDKHADIVAKYGATSEAWIPAVVVLDSGGKPVGVTDDRLRLTRRDTPATLLAILQQWMPKTVLVALSSFSEHGVHVALDLERDTAGRRWLAATFTPTDADVHLYSKDLPPDGIDDLGRPTRLDVDASSSIQPLGAVVANRPAHNDRIDALNLSMPVYPAGPVTLRMAVKLAGDAPVNIRVSYMGCGARGCLPPVIDRRVTVASPFATQR